MQYLLREKQSYDVTCAAVQAFKGFLAKHHAKNKPGSAAAAIARLPLLAKTVDWEK